MGPYESCSSPHDLDELPAGQHSFDVRAVDAAGNPDPNPRRSTFVIDLTAPDTRITSGPEGTVQQRSATFSFSSTESSTFECSLDGAPFSACSGSKSFDSLADGAHTFEVRATDQAGNPDPTPASRAFTVDASIRGLSVTAKPKQKVKRSKPQVSVIVSAGERVDVEASGKVKVGKKSVALQVTDAVADPEAPLTLRISPVSSGLRKVKQALKAKKKLKATVTVKVTDAVGNEQTTQLRVKLK